MTWSQSAFVGVFALVAVVRLCELVVSARRLKGRSSVSEPALFPFLVVLHIGVLTAPLAEVFLLERPFVPWLGGVAAGVLLLATALRVWTLRTIGRSWNVRVIAPEEGGVATGGPYAFIRHPNYLVVILEIASLPLLHTAWIAALALSVLNGLTLAFRIRNEEAHLMQVPAWREAFADKKRLIPGVF